MRERRNRSGDVDAETAPPRIPDVLQAYADVDRTVFLTAEDAERFRLAGLNNTGWIPNPVTLAGAETGAVAETGPARRNTIVALGRYDEVKSLHYLLAAWAEIAPALPDWSVELYGEGELRESLQALIDDRAIPRAALMGKTDAVAEVLASAKIHVISSQHEGLPISIVEAGLSGVPTVSFDCSPGVEMLIDSGRTGYIVAQNNVTALAERLQTLAADPAALAQMSDEVRADMAQYAPERILDRWEDLFREMAR